MTNRIEIIDDDDSELADIVVCRRLTSPLLMPDNLIDLCSRCGEAIQFRPYIPKLPERICDQCAVPIVGAEFAKGELVTLITPRTANEIAAFLEKKKAH